VVILLHDSLALESAPRLYLRRSSASRHCGDGCFQDAVTMMNRLSFRFRRGFRHYTRLTIP
jgi:hypothetical protein